MKSKIIVFAALILVLVTVLVSCNKKANENTKDENAYYTCPMHPQVHEDHPGTCPICGMDLVKREKQ